MKTMNNLKTFEYFWSDNPSPEELEDEIKKRAYYETHDDFVKKLHDKIEKMKQPLNGYYFKCDNDGYYSWYNDIYTIYATPYQHKNELVITTSHIDSDNYVDKIKIELPKLTSNSNVDKVFKEYKEKINNITKNLDRREFIIEKLQEIKIVLNFPIILNDRKFKSLEVKDYKLNGINFSKIKTSKLLKIYDEIEKEHPEVLFANKFNL
jgi:DNA-binding transcriptional regulator GbsR (MarR family)